MLHTVFQKIDADHSGLIQKSEVLRVDVGDLPEAFNKMVNLESLVELFDMLDVDQSGSLDESEFIDGVLSLVLSGVSVETIQMLKLLRLGRVQDKESHEVLEHVMAHSKAVEVMLKELNDQI